MSVDEIDTLSSQADYMSVDEIDTLSSQARYFVPRFGKRTTKHDACQGKNFP